MALKALKQFLGLIFSSKGNTTNRPYAGEEGLVYNKNDEELRTHINGSDRALLTDTGTHTLQNKTIDSANNTITIDADEATVENIEVNNLKAGVLDSDLSDGTSASHDTIPSAKATKDYVDAQVASKDEASEISYDNSTSGLTATEVQSAVDEVEGRLDTAETGLSDHLADTTDAHDASAISYVNATSGLTATDTQAAIDEVEGRLDTAESNITTNASGLSDHLADTTDAHDASAISYVNTTSGLAATDAQAAIDEVDGDLDTHIAASTAHGISGSVVGTTDTQQLTNKDIDGGTASNTSRITLPKDTTANLSSLTDKEGTLWYDTTLNAPVYNNGTDNIELASSSTPGTFAFKVYRNTTQNVTVSSVAEILFDAEEFDLGSCFNTSTSRFTPTESGVYNVSATVTLGDITAGAGDIALYIYKNNATPIARVYLTQLSGTSTSYSGTVTTNVQMNGTTDFLHCFVASGSDIDYNIPANANLAFFTGFRISAK